MQPKIPFKVCVSKLKSLTPDVHLKVMWDVLHDLVPLAKLKKRGKDLCKSVTFNKVAGFQLTTLLKVALFHGCFSRFLNWANDTKSRNGSHVYLEVDANL